MSVSRVERGSPVREEQTDIVVRSEEQEQAQRVNDAAKKPLADVKKGRVSVRQKFRNGWKKFTIAMATLGGVILAALIVALSVFGIKINRKKKEETKKPPEEGGAPSLTDEQSADRPDSPSSKRRLLDVTPGDSVEEAAGPEVIDEERLSADKSGAEQAETPLPVVEDPALQVASASRESEELEDRLPEVIPVEHVEVEVEVAVEPEVQAEERPSADKSGAEQAETPLQTTAAPEKPLLSAQDILRAALEEEAPPEVPPKPARSTPLVTPPKPKSQPSHQRREAPVPFSFSTTSAASADKKPPPPRPKRKDLPRSLGQAKLPPVVGLPPLPVSAPTPPPPAREEPPKQQPGRPRRRSRAGASSSSQGTPGSIRGRASQFEQSEASPQVTPIRRKPRNSPGKVAALAGTLRIPMGQYSGGSAPSPMSQSMTAADFARAVKATEEDVSQAEDPMTQSVCDADLRKQLLAAEASDAETTSKRLVDVRRGRATLPKGRRRPPTLRRRPPGLK